MCNRKIQIIIFFAIFAILISSCKNDQSDLNSKEKTANSHTTNKSSTVDDEDKISVSIFGEETLLIDKNRFYDDIYGIGQLNNRWSLSEVDLIIDSIHGEWETEKYIGFVVSSIYYPDLFNGSENMEEDARNNLIKDYNKKVKHAKKNIPNISFSIKTYNNQDTNSNNIIVNDSYLSPISIILSMDKLDENYPVFVDQTTLSMDFAVEYPVIYIKFFIKYNEDDIEEKYEPATLVLTKDNKFYILIDGAFYSVVRK